MIRERFNNENEKGRRRRSGPLPFDHIRWNERAQKNISLPVLKCLTSDDANGANASGGSPPPFSCYGDQYRAEVNARNAAPQLPGRFAIDPALDNRVRAIGSITVKLQEKNKYTAPGQRKLSVKGKGRVWTPAMRERERLRNLGNQYWKLRKRTTGRPGARTTGRTGEV